VPIGCRSARPAYPPTCAVRGRYLQQTLYVDSGRPLRADCVDEPLNWHRAEKRLLFGMRSVRLSASQGIESLEREGANGARVILEAWNEGKLLGQKGRSNAMKLGLSKCGFFGRKRRVGPFSRERSAVRYILERNQPNALGLRFRGQHEACS